MHWPTPFEWLGIMGILATLTSLVLAWGARDTKKILTEMEGSTKAILADMGRRTKALLERMETTAEVRGRRQE
jgi:hypothetical protein